MQFKDMGLTDLNLHLLSGAEIEVDNLEIKPYTLDEIRKYGYERYMWNLQWLLATVDDLIKSVLDVEKRMILESQKSKLTVFDFFIKLGGSDFLEVLLSILQMVFRTDDILMLDNNIIAIDLLKTGVISGEDEDGNMVIDQKILESLLETDLKVVHKGNFDSICEVVKMQNYLNNPNESPADEETRKPMEEMERIRKRVEAKKKAQQKAEKGDDSEIDITDIISAVTTKSNSVNKLNVWKHTLYQVYDEYSRLELIDNYDFSIKAMLAGAQEIELKHWSSKI